MQVRRQMPTPKGNHKRCKAKGPGKQTGSLVIPGNRELDTWTSDQLVQCSVQTMQIGSNFWEVDSPLHLYPYSLYVPLSKRCNLCWNIGRMFVGLRRIWNSLFSFRSEEMYSGNSLAPDKGNRRFIHSNVSFQSLHKQISNIGAISMEGAVYIGRAIVKWQWPVLVCS